VGRSPAAASLAIPNRARSAARSRTLSHASTSLDETSVTPALPCRHRSAAAAPLVRCAIGVRRRRVRRRRGRVHDGRIGEPLTPGHGRPRPNRSRSTCGWIAVR
jgi:hypothetical protein